ncbi:hypothetical protein Q4561_11650 [Alteromonas sp. 1_MG-2023]|uniref:hypothetical protein n=1 Tax=Alteromonas sp. 1_MG-2023 TaxID=3062669 RepID=UPI0026E255DD|nr:hypothetical protein [Alteromonas sp. 1_MG-2023]MDO6567714.1 hypothetical protein [Alteromonas sp. 1_MG-2023]
MKHFLFSISLSSFLGAAILFLSPYITGEIEPWDSDNFYYSGALFIAGLIILLDKQASYETVFIGIMLGQAIYMFSFMPVDSLVGVGLVIMAFKSLLSLIGITLKQAYLNARLLNGK